jgi:hypothetical protein
MFIVELHDRLKFGCTRAVEKRLKDYCRSFRGESALFTNVDVNP